MTTKGRLAAYAFAAAAAVSFTSTAQAASYFNFDGTSGTFGNNNIATSSFDDMYTIVLATAGRLSADVSSSSVNALTNVDFTFVNLASGTMTPTAFDIDSTGKKEARSISSVTLDAGTYIIRVAGTSGGNASYSGNLAVDAVPEAATWGMMIVGMGLAGSALRRRRRVTTKVSFA